MSELLDITQVLCHLQGPQGIKGAKGSSVSIIYTCFLHKSRNKTKQKMIRLPDSLICPALFRVEQVQKVKKVYQDPLDLL